MKNTKQRTTFLGNRAAVLTLAASLVIMGLFTACPNAAGGGGTSSGGTGGGTGHGGEITIPLAKLNIEGTVLKGFKEGENPVGILRVPAHITEIAERAFKDCTGITEVHLPENLTKIGTYAFKDCEGIIKLTMGKNLTRIDYGAFDSCINLEGRLEFPPNLAEIGGVAFSKCLKISALDFSKCTQPLTIGEYAFQGCKMTGTVKLPTRLSSLGNGVFWECNKVALFDFYACKNPPLTAIGTDAFEGTNSRFKVKTGTGIKALLTASGVAAGRIDEEP